MLISFVIPCYGSENTIEKVISQIDSVMKMRPEFSQEIILVNDCSYDGVWEVIKELSKKRSDIKGICLANNFGQHNALMAGYKASLGDIVVSMDDDGQSPVEGLFTLVDKLLFEDFDTVYSTAEIRSQSFFRRLGSRVNNLMAEILIKKPKGMWVTSFFVMRRFVVKEIIRYDSSYPYVLGLVLRTTKKIGAVELNQNERISGKSGYSLKSLLSLWLNGFTAFSIVPLRFATVCGGIFSVIGFIYAIYTFVKKLIYPNIPLGYSSLMCAVLVIGGMIMVMLGLIGEYLGRSYISINKSPQYVIRETAGGFEDPDDSVCSHTAGASAAVLEDSFKEPLKPKSSISPDTEGGRL